ncbi:hypothetical protein D3C78_1451070 [compost metagenome]
MLSMKPVMIPLGMPTSPRRYGFRPTVGLFSPSYWLSIRYGGAAQVNCGCRLSSSSLFLSSRNAATVICISCTSCQAAAVLDVLLRYRRHLAMLRSA